MKSDNDLGYYEIMPEYVKKIVRDYSAQYNQTIPDMLNTIVNCANRNIKIQNCVFGPKGKASFQSYWHQMSPSNRQIVKDYATDKKTSVSQALASLIKKVYAMEIVDQGEKKINKTETPKKRGRPSLKLPVLNPSGDFYKDISNAKAAGYSHKDAIKFANENKKLVS